MVDLKSLKSTIFDLKPPQFESQALKLFRIQAASNELYHKYLEHLQVDPKQINRVDDIPFLPIQFFKNHKIITGNWPIEEVFESSGTTNQSRSKHYIEDVSYYHRVSQQIFESRFGLLDQFHILALLPSYLERAQSSLINMIKHFMKVSKSPQSGFFLNDMEAVFEKLKELNNSRSRKILLWGVSFALLDLAEKYDLDLSNALIIATGGMKGRKEEIPAVELYEFLKGRWQAPIIHSEYGMTELMSQAYTIREGLFRPPSWMQVYIREINDPFEYCSPGRTGAVNILDLANIHSCAFIASDDLGLCHRDGTFEIFGRLDNSDQRGCNLMVPEFTD